MIVVQHKLNACVISRHHKMKYALHALQITVVPVPPNYEIMPLCCLFLSAGRFTFAYPFRLGSNGKAIVIENKLSCRAATWTCCPRITRTSFKCIRHVAKGYASLKQVSNGPMLTRVQLINTCWLLVFMSMSMAYTFSMRAPIPYTHITCSMHISTGSIHPPRRCPTHLQVPFQQFQASQTRALRLNTLTAPFRRTRLIRTTVISLSHRKGKEHLQKCLFDMMTWTAIRWFVTFAKWLHNGYIASLHIITSMSWEW